MVDIVFKEAARAALAAAVVAGAFVLVPAVARAGECPADQQRTDATAPVDHAARGVTDTVVGSIVLADEPVGIDDRVFRLRRLTIEPGGIVPWHSHGERPAIITIVSGEILEHASTCAVPILHRAGDTTTETHAVSHWWSNEGSEPVVLFSADLLKDESDHNM